MDEEGLSFFDIPWDVRYSSVYNELDCVDFSRLAATSKRMKVDALEDANWVRLLQLIKKSASWDRWLNQLTQRTWNFHPRLLYAVLKVILTHKSTTMSYVRASSTNGSVLLKNALVDTLVHLEEIFPLPAHLSLLFLLFTYLRHGSSVYINSKAGFTHGLVKIQHKRMYSWLSSHFKQSGSLARGTMWHENRFIRTFCEPFATLSFSFAIQWRQKPLLARKQDRCSKEEYGIKGTDEYWLFDFASASPFCPDHVKEALQDYKRSKKPANRPHFRDKISESLLSNE